jgi:hypothetical protein
MWVAAAKVLGDLEEVVRWSVERGREGGQKLEGKTSSCSVRLGDCAVGEWRGWGMPDGWGARDLKLGDLAGLCKLQHATRKGTRCVGWTS